MERTWKPTAAGILCIIAGAIGMIPSIVMALYLSLALDPLLRATGALVAVVGIMPIVGGIYALKRRIWGLALAGSIFALIAPVIPTALLLTVASESGSPATFAILASPLGILGILAIIFVIKGKREFR